jgi:hypothetical protein
VYQERLLHGFRDAYCDHFGVYPDAQYIAMSTQAESNAITGRVKEWFALPWEAQPTAIAVATSDIDWHTIERELALQGRNIAEGPPDNPERSVAVAGQASYHLHLAYGQGYAFTDITFASIGEVAVEKLLLPLLREETPENPIQRILPDLIPTKSLGLTRP